MLLPLKGHQQTHCTGSASVTETENKILVFLFLFSFQQESHTRLDSSQLRVMVFIKFSEKKSTLIE